jgi:hypothetical protein
MWTWYVGQMLLAGSLGGLLLGALPCVSLAQPRVARSGSQTVALLELYTSEGCNSCPPADDFVRTLGSKGLGLERVVPLGLHVDYWDRLGWPDRFAQPLFTQRQRAIAARQHTRTVYTPQLVLSGQSFDAWRTLESTVQRLNQAPARAHLSLELAAQTTGTLDIVAQAQVPAAQDRTQAQMYVALYENHLTSQVTAGENAGKTLRHHAVVRQWLDPVAVDAQGTVRLQHTFPLHADWQAANLGLVVFVQQPTGDVLQTLALPLGP